MYSTYLHIRNIQLMEILLTTNQITHSNTESIFVFLQPLFTVTDIPQLHNFIRLILLLFHTTPACY